MNESGGMFGGRPQFPGLVLATAPDEFIVAGAFGTYLDIASTVRTGMFPPLPLDRFRQVGNAAGAGARQMLVSADRRALAARCQSLLEGAVPARQPFRAWRIGLTGAALAGLLFAL